MRRADCTTPHTGLYVRGHCGAFANVGPEDIHANDANRMNVTLAMFYQSSIFLFGCCCLSCPDFLSCGIAQRHDRVSFISLLQHLVNLLFCDGMSGIAVAAIPLRCITGNSQGPTSGHFRESSRAYFPSTGKHLESCSFRNLLIYLLLGLHPAG